MAIIDNGLQVALQMADIMAAEKTRRSEYLEVDLRIQRYQSVERFVNINICIATGRGLLFLAYDFGAVGVFAIHLHDHADID